MKKIHRTVISFGVVFCLSCVWLWRYTHLNHYLQAHTGYTRAFYSIGEFVPFENDLIDFYEPAEGYEIKMDSLEIVEFDSFIQENGIELINHALYIPEESRTTRIPERLALVHITLRNLDSEVEGIMLPCFELFGIDSWVFLDYDLLLDLNPILAGNYGISLHKGTECELVLPYMLFKENFNAKTWNHFEEYTFYLRVTSCPTEKYIRSCM